MKYLITLLIFFNLSIYAQVHSWITLYNSAIAAPGTDYVPMGDTVYYVDGSNASTYSAYLIKIYKGLSGAQIAEPYNLNNGFIGSTYFASCAQWQNGFLFNYNDTLYNFGFGTLGACGYFSRQRVALTSYKSVVSNLYQNNSEYDICGVRSGVGSILGDSIYFPIYDYSLGNYNRVMVHSISNNTNNFYNISKLNNVRFNNWYRYVAGSFTIADTLYAITSYKNNYTIEGWSGGGATVFSDTVATLWKRNPTNYSWDSVKSFNRAGFVLDIKKTNKVYFLLAGLDSSQADCGLWEFDGNILQKSVRPPSLYRVVGFDADSNGRIWESVANSVVADSNKLYWYNNGAWDLGQTIYSSSESKNIFISNIAHNKSNVFVGSLVGTSTFNLGAGATKTAAYDTNYYYLSIQKPLAGYYNLHDTTSVSWLLDNINDSIQVWISYDSLHTFDSVKTVYGIDSTTITLDSVSNNCFIKIIRPSKNINSISGRLIVVNKYLSISNVYITPTQSPTINIIAVISNITSVNAYYSTDTVNLGWTYYGTFGISNQNVHTDTLSKSVNFAVNGSNSFYKLVEIKDTAVYNLSMQIITNFGFFVNPQICMSFAFYDDAVTGFPGGNDIKDVSCGWVGNITKYYGRVTTTVNTDGTVTVNSNETAYPYPYTNMPALTTVNLFQSCTVTNPFIYNGREYWVVTTSTSWYPSYDLWMKDLINNVSYPVLHLGSGGAGIVANWAGAQAQEFYGDIGVFRSGDGLSAVSAKLLSYPSSSGLPLSSVYNLTGGINYAYFRNYLRGIHPKGGGY